MSFSLWIDKLFRHPAAPRRRADVRDRRRKPTFEVLEDRITPTGNVLTVTSLNDAPTPVLGTLRYELALNVADNGGDTIVFEPQLQGTITVATPLPVLANVSIIGNYDPLTGKPLVTVSGGTAVQVFNINPSLSNVNFANLEITDGLSNSGGGVFVGKSSVVAFNNVTIDANSANSGGGIFIATSGNVTFVNSSIDNNTAGGPTGDKGGGLFLADSAAVKLYNSEVNGNSAIASGGGLYVSGNGTVQGNASVEFDTIPHGLTVPGLTFNGQPGVKFVESPPPGLNFIPGEISACEVNSNNATNNGGAISSNGVVTIQAKTAPGLVQTAQLPPAQINLNTSGGSAGAIRSFNGTGGIPGPGTQQDAYLSISDAVMDFNTATASEGAIYAQGNLVMNNTEVGNSQAGKNIGAIAFSGPPSADTATLTNVTVDTNTAAGDTGGISNGGNMVILDSTISGNIAGTEVGGIRDNAGTLWVINSTVANNQTNGATNNNDDGGGMILDGGTIHIINSTISGNVTANGRGGGIMVEAPVATFLTLFLQNSIVAGNKASGEAQGPDIYCASSIPGTGTAPNDTYTVQFSLIGDGAGTFINGSYIGGNATQTGGVNGNLVGPDLSKGSGSPINPLLGPLQNNGGPTPNPSFTMALAPTSPAINAGSNALAVDSQNNPLAYDQRFKGFPRIIAGIVDIGAYEYGVPIVISPLTLPTAFVGVPYSQQITATGGSGSFVFSVSTGSLPPGLTLSTAGLLSGIPTTTAGSPFSFTVTATDNNTGATGSQAYSLIVDAQLILTPATLQAWTVNVANNQTLTGSGGSGSGYTITEVGALPTGLSFSDVGATASFTGTPSVTGSFPIQVTLSDGLGGSITKNYTVNVYAVLGLTPATVPAALIGTTYSVGFTGTGGAGGYTYTEAGTLPTGISFSNGQLTGTATNPAQVGTSFPFTVTVKDSAGTTFTNPYNLTVENAIVINNPATLPNGEVTLPYIQGTPFSATGGSGSFTFSEAGTLPAGVILSGNTLTGTPTSSGTFTITVTALDSNGAAGSKAYTFTIIAAPTLSPKTLPAGTQTIGYSQTISATGGSGSPYTFSEVGPLDGLTLTAGGVLSGTPAATGTFTFTVTATDPAGGKGSQTYTLTVNAPLSLSSNPNPLPYAAVNGPYAGSIVATGGSGTGYTYGETGGILPPGLTLNSNGTITGATAPTPFGGYTFTVTAVDSVGTVGTKNFTIFVEAPIVLSPSSLPTGTQYSGYTPTTLVPSGGNGGIPSSFTLKETGALPAGMSFNAATGLLSGTPTQYGTFNFTVTATDSLGGTGAQNYSLAINFNLGNSPNANFVTAVYQLLLNRPTDPGAVYWVNYLNSGGNPANVVAMVESSPEYLGDQVAAMYQQYLGHAPDAAGQQYWVSRLQAGATLEQVAANIAASPEFFAKNGSTAAGFITGLYNDILGRTPSQAELNYWVTYYNNGLPRNGSDASGDRYRIAFAFLTSAEYRADQVAGSTVLPGYYPEFLQRMAGPSEEAYWMQLLQKGISDQIVLASIFGSQEGYNLWSVLG